MEEIRECKIHGQTVHKKDTSSRWRCRKCGVDAVQRRREKVKELAVEYKGGKCEICGYNKYQGALEFHHLDPKEKDFAISAKGYTRSIEKVKEELDKCVMLCANCHREVHDEKNINNHNIDNIRKHETNVTNYCKCGKVIEKKAKQCENCYNFSRRKVKERPSKEELIKELENSTYVAIAKKYGVSDNTIRKWLKLEK